MQARYELLKSKLLLDDFSGFKIQLEDDKYILTPLFSSVLVKSHFFFSGILVLYHWNFAWHFLMSFSGGASTRDYDSVKDHTEKRIVYFDMSTEKSKEKTWGQMFRGAGFRVQCHELGWANLTTHCQHLGVTLWLSPSSLSSLCHSSSSYSYLR